MKKFLLVLSLALFAAGVVYSGSITVTFPKAGDKLIAGKTYDIKFTITGCASDDVKINIFKDSIIQSNFVLQLTENNTDGKVSWKVPLGFESGNYALRVKVTPDEVGCQGDSGVFEISKMVAVPGQHTLEIKNKFTPVPGLHVLAKKPQISWAGTGGVGHIVLKPGSLLNVKGVDFGSKKGRIIMKGNFPGGQLDLEKVVWLNHLNAYGYVPKSSNGQPAQQVEIVIETSTGIQSDPYKFKFDFTGREEKMLVLGDAVLIHCGDDGNFNACNKLSQDGSICTSSSVICGYHKNNWGTVGDDTGTDSFQITLKNGWVFKSMQKLKWVKTSGDEVLDGPSPALPVGSSAWAPSINWLVTPNDHVVYQIAVIVEGPIGTDYK